MRLTTAANIIVNEQVIADIPAPVSDVGIAAAGDIYLTADDRAAACFGFRGFHTARMTPRCS